MRAFPRPIQIYIVAVITAGWAVLLFSLPGHVESSELVLFGTLAIAGALAGIYRFPLAYSHMRFDLTGALLLMAVFLADSQLACLLAFVVAVLSGLARRLRPWNIFFHSGNLVLSIGSAALLYRGIADPSRLPLDDPTNLFATLIASTAFWLSNGFFVIVLVASRNREPFLQNFVKNYRDLWISLVLMTMLAVLGSAAWREGAVYAFMLFVPSVAAYQWLSLTRLKQEQVIHAAEIIAEMLDRRNPFTFQHSHRVAGNVVKIAHHIGLTAADTDVLRRAALIHDIGKLGLDDSVQEPKPEKWDITDYQFYSLKQHAQLGAMIAREIPAFEEAEEPVRYHHDWYDGSHVSKGHAGEEIPLGARIIAVADSYDRLCLSNGEASLDCDPKAVELLSEMAGRQLDPKIASAFLSILGAPRPISLPEAAPVRAAAASS